MAWKRTKREFIKKKTEETVKERRNQEKQKAFDAEKIVYNKEEKEEIKKRAVLEEIHKENLAKREEREKERKIVNKIKEQKREEREQWKRKFQQRTKKGQIPLAHRINYLYEKIKSSKYLPQ